MLLTLGNLQALRTTVVPALNSQFENAFSVKLSDESKTIKDVLNQIDVELFRSYTQPSVDRLRALAQAGIRSPDWCPPPGAKPTGARAYVYECLLALVRVHSQVSTTAPSLTAQVLSFLLEQLTREMSDALRAARPRYPLEALMQATLDVEFVAQTLTLYTTAAATELQGGIYAELDRRTDDDARARLQGELPEMRNLLKKLREASRNEFACFKKARRQPTRDGDKE
jgi:exocyst complex component 2